MRDQPKSDRNPLIASFHQARRVIRIVIGFTVLLLGLAMVVLPGPAFVVIPVGLAILATEFLWAKKLLRRLADGAKAIKKGAS